MKKILLIACAAIASMAVWAQDIIVTKDAKKIDAKILEVSKSEIKYKDWDNQEGPTFILEVADINSIIYSNGKVVNYGPQDKDEIKNVSISDQKEVSLARVNSFNGVYVFTDCTPVAEYEVLGEVSFDKEGETHASTLMYYNLQSKTINTVADTYTETPQYTDIRDGLVTQAVMANRQVEGILISLPREGKGRATLIKFKEGATNKDLAKVDSHLGVLVFTDCMPANTYSFVGNIKGAGGLSANYKDLRDRLIQKAKKKYPTMQGAIIQMVSGGKDTAEAIRF